ncbi:tRNA (adenosine(37)-N6)-threonylcarbamoyltransferase complex dimerization subunit type 1 TsaB [Lachnobacterium bovis]|jgi:tRNA threonylcarbamoyladenosine biosynthesis protein TsaB|uniref:tRNA threonylcarbamoyladenosine biosynthesis protein TsaB n=1 Tax=Lachnobacterium bovis DSM 14045 TaxID=1122142 RepID=A0A1H3HDS0_9FIRM|nr:tRNA (adenosine(37)-N6)-threonylcarbamoyltransferase complex dimerization subunit type 1 TsaB [Lachnobacterium bovis]SDY13611.1 tRNA threonylcarbamoyladenosine biosynthesis protein TsaB [Lachnobacterium bovis DSM 14045]
MKLLAIDSSGMVASVAVVDEEKVLGEYTINNKKTHSQTLLPMIDEVVKMLELDLEEIDAIAISEGPGSFTGLRIGSATAKGIGLALNKKIVEVPTVEALAWNVWPTDSLICPLMDARRQQAYTGLFQRKNKADSKNANCDIEVIQKQCVVKIEEMIDQINEIGQEVIFLGDGVKTFKDYIEQNIKVPFMFAPVSMNEQRAASVACLGMKLLKEGKTCSASAHKPNYLRLSQAERERQQKVRDFKIC